MRRVVSQMKALGAWIGLLVGVSGVLRARICKPGILIDPPVTQIGSVVGRRGATNSDSGASQPHRKTPHLPHSINGSSVPPDKSTGDSPARRPCHRIELDNPVNPDKRPGDLFLRAIGIRVLFEQAVHCRRGASYASCAATPCAEGVESRQLFRR